MKQTLKINNHLDKHLNQLKSEKGEKSSLELATEGNGARISGDLEVTGYTDNIKLREEAIVKADGNVALDSSGDISLDADGGEILLKDGGAEFGKFDSSGILKLYEGAGADDDFFSIAVAAEGATILSTTDASGTDASIIIKSDGDLSLNSATGVFKAIEGLTEFSAANSAYAGMILGYTDIGLNEVRNTYTLTTGFVVPTDEFSVSFTAPPSGNVEIEIQIGMDVGSSNFGDLFAGLSSANATSGYSQLADFHESELFDGMSRGALG